MTVVAVHADAASVELHMDVGGAAFRGIAAFIEMVAIEVYREPTDRMLDQPQKKAQAPGEGVPVVVARMHAGFARLSASTASSHVT